MQERELFRMWNGRGEDAVERLQAAGVAAVELRGDLRIAEAYASPEHQLRVALERERAAYMAVRKGLRILCMSAACGGCWAGFHDHDAALTLLFWVFAFSCLPLYILAMPGELEVR